MNDDITVITDMVAKEARGYCEDRESQRKICLTLRDISLDAAGAGGKG